MDSARTDSARDSVCNSGRKGGSRVKVFVRVRPFFKKERMPTKDIPVVKCCVELSNNSVATLLDPSDGYSRKEGYKFDRCFWSCRGSPEPGGADLRMESQNDVYRDIGPEMLDNMFQGFNTCMFCYGQTGSGKTHTMMGKLTDREERGVIPRLCEEMFWRVKNTQRQSPGSTFKVEASYFEIYNEKVRDLLRRPESLNARDSVDLKVRQHPEKGPYVEGLSAHAVDDLAAIFFLMQRGSEERTTAATCMNDTSSRSHAIFTITFTQLDPSGLKVSKMNLVDLAGSERTSLIDSARHFKESTNINMSLTTLGRVIDALVERNSKQVLPPYRDSALTWLLSESLGGNSRTFMMATVSPAPSNYEETLSTLRYSSRARRIINQAHVNAVEDNNPVIKKLRDEVNWLKAQLELSGNTSARNTALQRQLADSEQEIQRLRLQLLNAPAEQSASNREMEAIAEENRRLRDALEQERLQNTQRLAALSHQLETQRTPGGPPMHHPSRTMARPASPMNGRPSTFAAPLQRPLLAAGPADAVPGDSARSSHSACSAAYPAGPSRTPLQVLNGLSSRSPKPESKGLGSPRPGGWLAAAGGPYASWTATKPQLMAPAPDTADALNSSRSVDSHGRPMSPPVTCMALLPSRSSTPMRRTPYFGVEVDLDADPAIRGVLLLGAHGPAAEAGVRTGDIVISVGHQVTVNREDLRAILFAAKPGDVLPLHILRGRQLVQCVVRAAAAEDQPPRTPSSGLRSRPSPGPMRGLPSPAAYSAPVEDGGTPPPVRRLSSGAPPPASSYPLAPGAMDSQGRRILSVVERAYIVGADGRRQEIPEDAVPYTVPAAPAVREGINPSWGYLQATSCR